jgi:hypothetical protein
MVRSDFYVDFDGASGERRPVSVRSRARRGGRHVKVRIEPDAAAVGAVYLLFRRGDGDLILSASTRIEEVEAVRGKLGSNRFAYEITSVPVL